MEEPRGTHRHDAVAFTPLRRPKEQRAKRRGTRGVEDPRGKQRRDAVAFAGLRELKTGTVTGAATVVRIMP